MVRGVGRPRDASLDARILEVARATVAARGYGALSMVAVAQEAGVGRQTLYRRWPRKPLLVFDAVLGPGEAAAELMPDTGTLAGDLRAITTIQTQVYRQPGMADLVRRLVADCLTEPGLLDELRRRFLGPRLEALRAVAERAAVRGDLDSSVSPAVFAEVLTGAMFAHFVLYGDDGTDFGAEVATLLTRATAPTTERRRSG